jgi:anaerobic magnesium-protoporphyrin IX monomethyl ester cyclase
MKILLINPPYKTQQVYGEYAKISPCLPPLGLCYLAAVLIKNGFKKIKIIDGPAEKTSFVQLRTVIAQFKPSIVGVTASTSNFYDAKKVLSIAKKVNQNITTVLGGPHITALPVKTMKECLSLDIGVIGEGELTFLELVKKLSLKKNIKNSKGTVVRNNNRIKMNLPQKIIVDLDSIPIPARDLLNNLKNYHHTPFRSKGHVATMITSRGCPFGCYFCDQSVFGKRWRGFSTDYIFLEMEHLKKNYGINFISFEDDNFLYSQKRTVSLCTKLIEKKLYIKWGCSARVDSINLKLLRLMKQAGCYNIFIGIESGSDKTLKFINKNTTIKEIRKAVNLIKKANLNVYGSFILGLPGESRQDILKSINFAKSLQLDGASFFLYNPYPNTILGSKAKKYGYISKDWRDYSAHTNKLAFVNKGMSEKELKQLQRYAYIKFFLRFDYLFSHWHLLLSKNFWLNGFSVLVNYLFKK